MEYSGEDKIQNNVNNVWFALWSLNTLKKLQNSFQASVSSLMDAKEQLVEQISYVSVPCTSLFSFSVATHTIER